MFKIVRAAGLAVAALGFTASPAAANPFLFLQSGPAIVAAALPSEAAAGAKGTELALNTAKLPSVLAYESDFATPLSELVTARPIIEPAPAVVAKPADVAEKPSVLAEKPRSKSLGDLVHQFASTDVPDAEHECLAGAVYFESKGEPLEGQLAVAKVILNRANSGKYPKSLCGVVKQKSQFSFVRGGRIPPIKKSEPAWKKAVAIAHVAKQNLAKGLADTALFFHARYVSPSWRGLKRIATVGNHIFYR